MKTKLKMLKKVIPFKWRVQSQYKTQNGVKIKMLAYVDARQVEELLDDAVGSENWQDKYYSVKDTLFCSIGIRVDGEWIWKSDAGIPSKMSAKKGEASDAFKRAAVKWGINRDAYNMELLVLNSKEYNGKSYPVNNNNKFLKGQDLHDYCNSIAKIEELENYDLQEETDNSNNLK